MTINASQGVSRTQDIIRINDLSLTVRLDDGAKWPPSSLQPVLVTLSIFHDIEKAAESDSLSHSIDYSSVCSTLVDFAQSRSYRSLEELSDCVFMWIFQTYDEIQHMALKTVKLKPPLHCRTVVHQSARTRSGSRVGLDRLGIEDLDCHAIIGANTCERDEKQVVRLGISVESQGAGSFDFRAVARSLYNSVQITSFVTLEALASFAAHEVLRYVSNESDTVTVLASKPDALVFAASAGVEVRRTRADYVVAGASVLDAGMNIDVSPEDTLAFSLQRSLSSLLSPTDKVPMVKAAIALGSNLGDRFANIELALRLLEEPNALFDDWWDAEVVIVDTSFMYETAPMYVTDQPAFINCACAVETNLSPQNLLLLLKKIETAVGRVPSIRNGPRAVDLDIIIFGSDVLDTRPEDQRRDLNNLEGHLVVPHPRMVEREFVLRPMNDMLSDFVHPTLNKSIHVLLQEVMAIQSEDVSSMKKVIPFPRYPVITATHSAPPLSVNPPPPTAIHWTIPSFVAKESAQANLTAAKTYIMATLNATPDSFSDGSVNNALSAALSYAISSVSAGADIIDIGGYSTRPGAAYVSPDEELGRVVPIIQALRDLKPATPREAKAKGALISVDTFRADVAMAAVLAGANCINDVYAFTGPEYPLDQSSADNLLAMRQVAKTLAVPVVLMHSRGDAGSNKDYSTYNYALDRGETAVVEGVRVELGEKVDAIVKGKGGLRRWLVVVDPGVGFSKTVEGNLDIMRHASSISADENDCPRNLLAGFPLLIGPSRKSFLGVLLAQADSDSAYEGRATEPKERGWATAAAVACAAQQGASVIRVHDVLEMGDVIRVTSFLRG